MASSFGYIDTLSNGAWILAALLSISLLSLVPIYDLFYCVSVTSLVALVLIIPLGADKRTFWRREPVTALSGGLLRGLRKEFQTWPPILKTYAALSFFGETISVVGSFLIPLFAYTQGAPLGEVVLIAIILASPWTLAYHLGKLSDRFGNRNMVRLGLLTLMLVFFVVACFHTTPIYLVAALILGLIEALIQSCVKSLVTAATHPSHYGRVSAVMEGMSGLASLSAPIILGFLADAAGQRTLFVLLAFVTLGICLSLGTGARDPDYGVPFARREDQETIPSVASQQY